MEYPVADLLRVFCYITSNHACYRVNSMYIVGTPDQASLHVGQWTTVMCN